MRRLGVVGLVLVGLLAFSQAVSLLTTLVGIAYSSGPPGFNRWLALGLGLLPVAVSLGLGSYLIARRDSLAARWFDDEPLEAAVDPAPFLRLALVVLGVWLFATSVPWLIAMVLSSGAQVFLFSREGMSGYQLANVALGQLGSVFARLLHAVVGIVLVVRATQLSTWLLRPTAAAPAKDTEQRPFKCPSCGAPYDPNEYREGAEWRCVECDEPLGSARHAHSADSALER